MCKERQDLYKKIKSDPKNKSITFDKWKKLLHEAKSMGVEKLTISGGEPTLYPHLYWLIRYSKSLGFTTLLNTNGINLKEDIIATELDAITFSLESLKTDSLRDGRYTKKILELIPKLKNKIHININTIMTKQNFKDIPEIYLYCKENGLNLILSYLEFFDDKSIRNTINAFKMESKDYDYLIKQIPVLKDKIQKKSSSPKCTIPGYFALILPNGDVHPCNIVEYAHEPVMGNVHHESLGEIWDGQKYRLFRAELHNGCKNCMIPQRIFLNHDGSNDKHLSFQLS
jgi:MoaA/NifB/PqqE/SkfB family radical SAM enzyme